MSREWVGSRECRRDFRLEPDRSTCHGGQQDDGIITQRAMVGQRHVPGALPAIVILHQTKGANQAGNASSSGKCR